MAAQFGFPGEMSNPIPCGRQSVISLRREMQQSERFVTSFAALVKGRGFVLIFSPDFADTLLALALCTAFLSVVAVLKCFAD